MKHENICGCEDNNIKPTYIQKVNGKQKWDSKCDNFCVYFLHIFYSNYPFFASIRISFFFSPFSSSRKTVKSTNKLYRREMTLSVKIKKKMDFSVPSLFILIAHHCFLFLTNAKRNFMKNQERKLLKFLGNHQKSVVFFWNLIFKKFIFLFDE